MRSICCSWSAATSGRVKTLLSAYSVISMPAFPIVSLTSLSSLMSYTGLTSNGESLRDQSTNSLLGLEELLCQRKLCELVSSRAPWIRKMTSAKSSSTMSDYFQKFERFFLAAWETQQGYGL